MYVHVYSSVTDGNSLRIPVIVVEMAVYVMYWLSFHIFAYLYHWWMIQHIDQKRMHICLLKRWRVKYRPLEAIFKIEMLDVNPAYMCETLPSIQNHFFTVVKVWYLAANECDNRTLFFCPRHESFRQRHNLFTLTKAVMNNHFQGTKTQTFDFKMKTSRSILFDTYWMWDLTRHFCCDPYATIRRWKSKG